MNLPKLFFSVSLLLFGSIGALAIIKRSDRSSIQEKMEIEKPSKSERTYVDAALLQPQQKEAVISQSAKAIASTISQFDEEGYDPRKEGCDTWSSTSVQDAVVIEHDTPSNSLKTLFEKNSRCPIVQTVRYTSRVSWKPKKSAWLVDYAHHYKTPLEFIYRSMNPTTISQNGTIVYSEKPVQVSEGSEFNVFRSDVPFHFYLVISFASLKARLYYILPEEKKAVFLTSYPVCLGRKATEKKSGSLTPFGLYQLGTKVIAFQPNMKGPYKGKNVEMIQVFGSRWMPFEREVDPALCTEPAKGFGIHGTPMERTSDGTVIENNSSIGAFESDGCIRLSKNDVEELYSLVSIRRAYVEIVPDFAHSRLMQGQM